MSEDRTQAPSPRRRQLARERGQVARSGDLTAAVALLAATILIGFHGGDLVEALVSLARQPWSSTIVETSAEAITARIRGAAASIAGPLAIILGGTVIAAISAHQMQVRGLWAPALLAPDPARLWGGFGSGFLARGGRGVWSLARAAVIVAVAAWLIRAGFGDFERFGRLGSPEFARASGSALKDAAVSLSIAMVGLGLLDYALQWTQQEARLRLTPNESREEMRALDGDPALRSRRRQTARNRESGTLSMEDASLVLLGDSGLVVVLSGGPPPARVTVLASARGSSGSRLLRLAEDAGLAAVSDPALALRFSHGLAAGSSLPPDLSARLIDAWRSA